MRLNLLQEIDPMILEYTQVIIRLVLEQTESINGELVSDNEVSQYASDIFRSP